MPRSFIIGANDPPPKIFNIYEQANLAPTFNDYMPTLTVEGVELLATLDVTYSDIYYEQILNRYKPMNINGAQEPYILMK